LGVWGAGTDLIVTSLDSASSALNVASSISRERFRDAAVGAPSASPSARASAHRTPGVAGGGLQSGGGRRTSVAAGGIPERRRLNHWEGVARWD
jgi:hypothetical protein